MNNTHICVIHLWINVYPYLKGNKETKAIFTYRTNATISSQQKKSKADFSRPTRNSQRNFNRALVFYTIVVTKHTILSSAPTKDTSPPQSIDIIMRNREKLLLWNEKRKFVIRRRFPPLLFLSLSLLGTFACVRERLPLVLGAGLFLSMLATLFSLLYPPELGLSCLFEWTMAPLHGG